VLVPAHYPVTCNTKYVACGSTFVAIPGFTTDGARFIPEALAKGATRIVVSPRHDTQAVRDLCAEHKATLLVVENPRKALAALAAEALDFPAQKLHIIGVTGTKGKSTTTLLVERLLRKAGYKTALINTIYNSILGKRSTTTHTTPEADYLQLFFATCVQKGVTHVVMEVSSHALSLHRVDQIPFATVGFTNLAPEHMDFYPTMDDYFQAKAQLFSLTTSRSLIVINADTEWSAKALAAAVHAAQHTHAHVQTYGQQDSATAQHVTMHVQQASCDGIDLILNPTMGESLALSCPQLFGVFNCYNIAMAALIARHAGLTDTDIINGLRSFKGVPGRLQRHVLRSGALAFIDYAHNPSSMEEVLKTLRPFTSHLVVLFGCGGDRDKTKRPVMGALASQYGDTVIVTDDNPRSEDRLAIIEQVVAGIPHDQRSKVLVIPDRREAIAHAAQIAPSHAIIAILGKGHENYYLIGDQRLHLSDFEEIGHF